MQKYYGKIEYLVAFFIGASFMFSNVRIAGLDLNNFLTITTFLFAVLIVDYKAILITVLIALVILISTLNNIFTVDYWITFVYKATTTYPIVLLVKRKCYDKAYKGCLHSFLLSNSLAILYLIVNKGTTHKFILYFDVIPRYAALAKEPVSFALFTLGLYILFFFCNPKFSFKRAVLFTIPILIAVSGVIMFKFLADVLWKFKKKIYYYWILLLLPVSVIFFTLWTQTRISDSFSVRLAQYFKILEGTDFVFFGSGFYQAKGFIAGLPGLFRVYFELGIVFYLFLFVTIIYQVYAKRTWKEPMLLLAIFFPFLTEAYGAQYVWMIFGFALTYTIKPASVVEDAATI